MKKTINFLVIIFFTTISLFSQSMTDAEDIFKMHLFLDKQNISRNDIEKNVVKNDSLFNAFKKNCIIIIDTLKIEAPKYLPLDGDFTFFMIKNIDYKKDMTKSELWYLKVDFNLDYKYIIAINKETGRSYCLSGFHKNDFFIFFSDLSKAYRFFNFKKLKISFFLKNYKVENLDFECLYKGLKKREIDKDRFPCLRTPNVLIRLH
jgi:hypothetical protein